MLTDQQILELRSHFPILQSKTYLYNCSQGALSDVVEGGLQAYAASWRTSAAPWDDWMATYEDLRTQFARFINARPDEVAIVTSASAGINPIANALSFEGRNKVVLRVFGNDIVRNHSGAHSRNNSQYTQFSLIVVHSDLP